MGEFFIYSLFFGALFYLFPTFLYIDAYAQIEANKCWFSISLFRHLKIFGGYFQVAKDGIVFHLGPKKAVILPYEQMSDTRKKFEITKGFQLWRFHQITEIYGEGTAFGVMISAFLQTVGASIFSILRTSHPFLSLKNGTLLTCDKTLKITIHTALVLNGLVLTVAISKKILEEIIKWSKEKKLTTLWRKRHSNSQA